MVNATRFKGASFNIVTFVWTQPVCVGDDCSERTYSLLAWVKRMD